MENVLKMYANSFKKGQARTMPSGGVVFTWLATGKETGGQFALFEARGIPGMEPPPHVHTHEDESFYILEGELLFIIGEEEIRAVAGDFIFMPRNIRHQFKVLSPSFRCLACICPAGLEEYFEPLSIPHTTSDIPPVSTTPPPPEALEMMQELDRKFGITYFST